MKYLVTRVEFLRDGEEKYSKIFDSLEEAMKWINSHNFPSLSYAFRVFEVVVGKEITIIKRTIEGPQPPGVTWHYFPL